GADAVDEGGVEPEDQVVLEHLQRLGQAELGGGEAGRRLQGGEEGADRPVEVAGGVVPVHQLPGAAPLVDGEEVSAGEGAVDQLGQVVAGQLDDGEDFRDGEVADGVLRAGVVEG